MISLLSRMNSKLLTIWLAVEQQLVQYNEVLRSLLKKPHCFNMQSRVAELRIYSVVLISFFDLQMNIKGCLCLSLPWEEDLKNTPQKCSKRCANLQRDNVRQRQVDEYPKHPIERPPYILLCRFQTLTHFWLSPSSKEVSRRSFKYNCAVFFGSVSVFIMPTERR